MPQRRIYLDHNATTRPHPSVRAAMDAALVEHWGNPSSLHGPGRTARDLVERARAEVAALVHAASEEIVFTSGGTESDNLALRGAAHAMRASTGRRTILSSPIEHPAVLESLATLAREGFHVVLLPVDGEGRIDPADLASRLDGDTALCSFALANHEIGNLYPVASFAALAHAAGALVHCDAVQAAGKVPVDVRALDVDLLSLSAHKLYGPKGIGALFCRRDLSLAPLLVGGHQEKARRPGTENVPGAVGFGVACVLARGELAEVSARVTRLRDRLEAGVLALDGARRFGCVTPRVPNTLNVGFAGVEGEVVLMGLDLEGIAVATGAACSSGSVDPSPVIVALGAPRREALGAVRFSLGRDTTDEEIDVVLSLLPIVIERARNAG